MSKKLVIMASKEGREALRACGVLPASVFRDFAEIDEHDYDRSLSRLAEGISDDGATCQVSNKDDKRLVEYAASLGFYVWPHDPDYKCAAAGFGDYPLLSMLGMEPPKSNAEYLERKIAYTKLLGSTILHVILLDKFDLADKVQKPSPCFISPVVKWCDTFQEEILREYSDEQAAGIEHVFILVARNPCGLEVNVDDVESFCRRLNCTESERTPSVARIRTCFFLDRQIEIEVGDDLFPSGLIWAQMVGRLLFRILIGLEHSPNDPIGWCDGGIRLWKASEFALDFQPERVHTLMSQGVGNFIDQLRTGDTKSDIEPLLNPWVQSVDCVLKTSPIWKNRDESQDWNKFPAKECEQETFDDGRWQEVLCQLKSGGKKTDSQTIEHVDDADHERKRLTRVIHSSMTSADSVQIKVSQWVSEISKKIQDYFTKDAGAGVSKYWDNVVKLCFRRAQCKDVLEDVADNYELAKSHYVQKKHCRIAVVAISLCAGLAFSRLVSALGGGFFLILLLWAGTFAGALVAIYIMKHQHDNYGHHCREKFLRLCETADKCIVARDECARDQIREAVEVRARMLQLAKMRHFNQLVSRLQNMIDTELVAPSTEVFIEDDLVEPIEAEQLTGKLKSQRDRFFVKTNYRVGFDDQGDRPARVRTLFPDEYDSFRKEWTKLCGDYDKHCTANFPARYFIPFLKRTLRSFRNKYRPEVWCSLAESSIRELNDKFHQPALRSTNDEDVFEISRRIREFVNDDACYSAHIDLQHRLGLDMDAEFYYATIFDNGQWSQIKDLWEGLDGITPLPSRFLLGRTPHFAILFTQSQVNFTVKDRRLTLRVVGEREEDDNV